MRKRIYLAGPISKGDLKSNIDQATSAFVQLAKLGFAPFCPHWSVYSKPTQKRKRIEYCVVCRKGPKFPIGACNDCEYLTDVLCTATTEGNDQMTHEDWLGVDLPWVAVSDAVLRLPGESKGADAEVALAREVGVPVHYSIGDLVESFHLDRRLFDLEHS